MRPIPGYPPGVLALLVTLALADDTTCVSCCKAGGLASCPTVIHVRTEKSGTDASGMGWDLQGVWALSCDGSGRFDPTFTATLDHEPEYAEVIGSGTNPLALHCFVEACALPQGVCVGQANLNGDVQLVGCDDTLPVDQRSLAGAPQHQPSASAVVVVIDGRPIVAEKAEPGGSQPSAAPSGSDPAPAPLDPYASARAPGWPPAPSPAPAPGAAYDPYAPVSAPTYQPAPSPSPAPPPPAPSAPAPLVLDLPPDPPDPCVPAADAMRAESRKRVSSGDDFRMANRPADALKDYRAALTMDKCNGYAWMSIAQVANDAGRTDVAVRALRHTTRLVPTHPGGWLMLGRAYEAIGQRTMAAEAYKKATEIAPGNAEAIEGYMRTRG